MTTEPKCARCPTCNSDAPEQNIRCSDSYHPRGLAERSALIRNVGPDGSDILLVPTGRPAPHGHLAAIRELIDKGHLTGDAAERALRSTQPTEKVNCAACGEPFRWNGVLAGLSPAEPRCSVDETELRAPLRPASADPDFGLGLPGFSVIYREAP